MERRKSWHSSLQALFTSFFGLFLDALAGNSWPFVRNSLCVFARCQMAHDSSIRGNNTSRALFEGLDSGHAQKKADLKSQRQKKTDNLGHFSTVTDTNEALLHHQTGL